MSNKAESPQFSDVWAELIHSGRWYRGITVLLSLVNLLVIVTLVILATAPEPLPLVVRVDEVGSARVVDYELDRAELDQNSPVVASFLNEFVVSHYSRRNALGSERWERSLVFLSPDLQSEAYDRDVEELSAFIADPDMPEFFVQDILVRVIPQQQPPYRAEVIFDRVELYRRTEISRERLTVSIHFVFAENVPPEVILMNPLGIVVVFMDTNRELLGVGDDLLASGR